MGRTVECVKNLHTPQILLFSVRYPAMVGGALCHLLPDSMEDIGTISYPLAGALAGLGYILTMMMEAVATSIADSVGVSHCHQLEDSPEDLEGIWVQDVYDSFDEIPHQDHADSTEFTEGQCL